MPHQCACKGFAALVLAASLLAGCAIPVNEHQSWGNQVWRMAVLRAPATLSAQDLHVQKAGIPDFAHRRAVRVFMQQPGLFGEMLFMTVLVPDQIPALHDGDIVDVYLPDPMTLDWSRGQRFYRVVRLGNV